MPVEKQYPSDVAAILSHKYDNGANRTFAARNRRIDFQHVAGRWTL